MSENIDEKNGKKYLRISVSKAKTFHQCKNQFKFNYIDKLPKITRDYHVLGTFCHKVLEDFHKSYINGSIKPFNEELTVAWKAACEESKKNLTPEIKAEARTMMNGYLDRISKQKANGTLEKVLGVEDNFKIDLDEKVLLNGMIDRVQQDSDGMLHIADYKSTKNKKYLKDDFFQLLTYSYVILSENPELEKVRASYILLRHDFEYITKVFTREEAMKVKDIFLQYYEDMNAETEYPANPTMLCHWCDYLEYCEEGQVIDAQKFGQKIDNSKFGEVKW